MEQAIYNAIGNKADHVRFVSDEDQEDALLLLRYKLWKEKRTVLTWAVDRPTSLELAGDNTKEVYGQRTYDITVHYPR